MIDPRRIPVPVLTALIALLSASSPAWMRRAFAQTDETAVHQASPGAPGEDLAEDDDEEMSEILDPEEPVTDVDESSDKATASKTDADADSAMDGDADEDEAKMDVEEDESDQPAPNDSAASAKPAKDPSDDELMQGDEDSDEEDEDEALETASSGPSDSSKPADSKPAASKKSVP